MKQMSEILRDIRNSHTFRLMKEPSTFLEGVSSVFDVGGKIMDKYNTDDTDENADLNALRSDWRAVGEDMYSALDTYDKQRS